jgi:hypothetical protein
LPEPSGGAGPRSHLRVVPPRDDPYWRGVYQDLLKSSLCLFAKDVLGLEIGPHLLEWGDMVMSHRRIAINAARDHSKSTFFSYAYPIWRAWSEPGCEVYLFSATLDQAMDFLDTIVYGNSDNTLRGMVDIPELQHLVPTREDFRTNPRVRLTRQRVQLTNGSRFRAIGYGKKIRGRHPKYVVLDDVLNDEDLSSETVRNKHIEYFRSAIVNMVAPDGQLVCVGTPYHMGDLWGWLRENEAYKFKVYPGIYTDSRGEERALFPWRWTIDQLREKKKEIGSIAFTREILCRPISDDLSIFPQHLWPKLYATNLTLRPSLEAIRAAGLQTFMGVDIALSTSVGADYFVCFTIGVDAHGDHQIIDIYRKKGLSFKRQLELIEHYCRRYGVDLCYIESNQAQRVWSDEMKRTTDVPVKEFVTTAQNKYPLDKGVPSLRILLENEKIVIPRGDEYSRRMTNAWIGEAVQFGFVDGKLQGAGTHDDTVMAWWMATEARKRGGFSFAMGDEDAEEDDEMTGGGSDGEAWEEVMLGKDEDEDGGALF